MRATNHGAWTRLRCHLRFLLLIACVAWVLVLGCSDEGTGSTQKGGALFVEVRDRAGLLVAGASITTTPETASVTTDEAGSALILEVARGTYHVLAVHEEAGAASDAVEMAADELVQVHLRLDGTLDAGRTDTGGAGGAEGEGGSTSGGGGRMTRGGGGGLSGAPPGAADRAGAGGLPEQGGAGGAGDSIAIGRTLINLVPDPNRPYLYALDTAANAFVFINLETGDVSDVFVGSSPVDMDFSEDGAEMFVANFGSTEIAVVDLDLQEVGRSFYVDTSRGTWEGNPYRIAAMAGNTLVFTSEDQWCDLKLVNAVNGAHIYATGSLYQPDLKASSDGTKLYIAEYGSTGSSLHRYDLSAGMLTPMDESSTDAGYGSRLVVMSGDGEYVFYGRRKLRAANLQNVLGELSENVYATNHDGSIAIGGTNVFDSTTFRVLAPLPFATTVLAMAPDSSAVYLYDATQQRIQIYHLSPP